MSELPSPGEWWVPQTKRAKPRYVQDVKDGRITYASWDNAVDADEAIVSRCR
jgi:hypothetical protein